MYATCGLADARLDPAEFASLPSAAAFRQGGGLKTKEIYNIFLYGE
jgi:hypothetical protein